VLVYYENGTNHSNRPKRHHDQEIRHILIIQNSLDHLDHNNAIRAQNNIYHELTDQTYNKSPEKSPILTIAVQDPGKSLCSPDVSVFEMIAFVPFENAVHISFF
jgi:hypothetical protein